MDQFLANFFNAKIFLRYGWDIAAALWVTIYVSGLVIVVGTGLGLLLACIRTYRCRPLTVLVVLFADVGRAVPPLAVILLLYFGLPSTGILLSGTAILVIVLGLVLASFAEEIFWAGISSINKGQWEVGQATGIGHTLALVHIILPQAVRIAIPPLANRVVAISKMTALGSVIGIDEVLAVSSSAQNFSGSATPLTMAAIAYLAIFIPMIVACHYLERRFSWKH